MSVNDSDTGPQNLDKLRDMLPGMRTQRRSRMYHRPGSRPVGQKVARQVCNICWKLFDYAICPATTQPTLSRCSECTSLLAEGYTAFVTIGRKYRFVKSIALKPELRGKVRLVEDAALDALVAKFEKHDPQKPDHTPPAGDLAN